MPTTSASGDHGLQAVLVSGGIDSAVLLAEVARAESAVVPIYVRCGHVWEPTEQRCLAEFIAALGLPSVAPLCVLDLPVNDLIPGHWSLTGRGVPAPDTPDEAVYLPGRNALLLVKALVWCHLHGVNSIALALLRGNPFADAAPEFLSQFAGVINRALGGRTDVRTPFRGLSKADVVRRGLQFPIEYTFSCINLVADIHCGVCSKCRERRDGFRDAGVPDPTRYANK